MTVVEAQKSDRPISTRAPARVNLLGEHTDYSGGLVMPMAISFATLATISGGAPVGEYVFRSSGFAGETRLKRGEAWARQDIWSDYPVGVLDELRKAGIEPPEFVVEFAGDVPLGGGLNSSASVEVAPLGMIFTALGLILLGYGAATNHNAMYAVSMGVNINVLWGAVMLVFGLAMLIVQSRRSGGP